jgi:hypothetical protein
VRAGTKSALVHPLPYAPFDFGRRDWNEIARMAAHETRDGIAIERPRYLHVPRFPRTNAPRLCARRNDVRAGAREAGRRRRRLRLARCGCGRALAQGRPALRRHGRGSDVLQVAARPSSADCSRAALDRRPLVRGLARPRGAHGRARRRPGRGVLVAQRRRPELFRLRDARGARASSAAPERARVLVVGT